MTQLGELRDAHPKFEAAGIKIYAVSYDDREALAAFAEAQRIPFPLLCDVGSQVIRAYGILNTQVGPDEVPFYGIPFPGTYVLDESGVVVEKFFPRHIANRECADAVLESSLGRILIGEDEPRATGGEDGIRITAAFHGGGGTLKSGIRRRVVVRFELPEGLHIYGEPVPEGLVPATVTVHGPEGFIGEKMEAPPTTPLRLDEIDATLHVWSGTVDLAVPVWANSKVIDVLDDHRDEIIRLEVEVRYQACSDTACLIPRTERFALEVPLAPLDVPRLPGVGFEGQRVTEMDSLEHLRQLAKRFE